MTTGKIAQAAAIVSNYADSYERMGAKASVAANSARYDMLHNIIPAILALASPDALTAEPVAWGVQMRDKWWVGLWHWKELAMKVAEKHAGDTVVPLYATPPAAQDGMAVDGAMIQAGRDAYMEAQAIQGSISVEIKCMRIFSAMLAAATHGKEGTAMKEQP